MDQAPGAVSNRASRQDLRSILIVDDSEGDALLAEMALLEIVPNAVVHHVDNGRSALELLESRAFDLVLLDLAMPGLTGFDVLDTVAGWPDFTSPVLVLTSSSRAEDRARVARHEVGYVVKDSDFGAFSHHLAVALGTG